jgi:glycosyltransferase involved in cell wall biosynthesis
MEKNPLISIVVPSYNVAPYIRQCIESILNQTFSNWELLLVVGGTDGTVEICENMLAKTVVSSPFMTIKD